MNLTIGQTAKIYAFTPDFFIFSAITVHYSSSQSGIQVQITAIRYTILTCDLFKNHREN